MATRAYLHVGTMKSATTHLQQLCDANAAVLGARGILWQGSAANFAATRRLGEARAPGGAWHRFHAAIEAHDGVALVSNELLAAQSRARLGELVEALAPVPVDFVVTARDLGRVLPSQWQERARNRVVEPWPVFMARLMDDASRDDPQAMWFWRRQDLGAIARKLASIVGPERVVVVTVPRAGAPTAELHDRFLGAVGLSPVPALVEPVAANPSMGAHSTELARRVHARLTADQRETLRLALKQVLARRVLGGRPGEPPITLAPAHRAWAETAADAMIAELRATGVVVRGDLDDLRPAVVPQGVASPASAPPTDAELVDAAVDALIEMTAAVDELARRAGGEHWGDLLRELSRESSGALDDDASD